MSGPVAAATHMSTVFFSFQNYFTFDQRNVSYFPSACGISEKDNHGLLTIRLRKCPGILSLVTALPPDQRSLRLRAGTGVNGVRTSFRPVPQGIGSRVPGSQRLKSGHTDRVLSPPRPRASTGRLGQPPSRQAGWGRRRVTVISNESLPGGLDARSPVPSTTQAAGSERAGTL